MRSGPRLALVHLAALAALLGAWQAGLLDGAIAAAREPTEAMMLGALCLYAGWGMLAVLRGDWKVSRHVANGLPMWGLGCTGVGMVLAVSHLQGIDPGVMTQVFRQLAFAIMPNILAVVLMTWIREMMWWMSQEHI